jgi:hypothetical protein
MWTPITLLTSKQCFEDYFVVPSWALSMGIQQTLIENSCGKLLWCVQGHIKRVSLGSWETFIEVKNMKPIKKA